MDFNRYCKYCGSITEELGMTNDGLKYKCECRDELLNYDKVIPGFTREAYNNYKFIIHYCLLFSQLVS